MRYVCAVVLCLLAGFASAQPARVAPAVASEYPEAAMVFPVVGSAPGAGGLFFRSETTLVNLLSRSQRVSAAFYPSSGGCGNLVVKTFTLAANEWRIYKDVVAELFGAQGLGAVVVLGIDPSGAFDSSAQLDGFSRIWTPSPFGGTASQSFPPVSLNEYTGTMSAYGLRQDDGFRTNVGVFNYLNVPRTFDVFGFGANGLQQQMALTVPPCGMVLTGIPAGNYGSVIVAIRPRESLPGWYGFASSVDNISGDNWSSPARP